MSLAELLVDGEARACTMCVRARAGGAMIVTFTGGPLQMESEKLHVHTLSAFIGDR